MLSSRADNHADLVGSGTFALYALVAAAPMWLILAGSFALHEFLVGVVVLVASVSFALLIHSFRAFDVHLALRDIAQGWRLPWYLLADWSTILAVLFKDLFHIAPAGSYLRMCAFRNRQMMRGTQTPQTLGGSSWLLPSPLPRLTRS